MGGLASRVREGTIVVVTLFTSAGTLICCALPITLVTLGLGSAVVALTQAAPWLVALSRHKAWVFAGSAGLLVLGAWLVYRPGRACPPEPRLARLCRGLDRWNRRLYWAAVGIWAVGFFFAFLWLPLRQLAGTVG